MKTYTAKGSFHEDAPVLVEDGDLTQPQGRPLVHHVRHSPDGHSWGYNGSGPNDLAQDILWDAYGVEPDSFLVRQFKQGVVAHLPQDAGFILTEARVREFINNAGGFQRARHWLEETESSAGEQ